MKRKLILSLIIPLITMLGCGSGGGDNSDEKKSVDTVLKLGDVAYKAPQGIDFQNKTNMKFTKSEKRVAHLQKLEEVNCGYSGTASYEENSEEMVLTYNKCIEYNNDTEYYEYYNGVLTASTDYSKIEFKKYDFVPNAYNYPNTGTYMDVAIESSTNGLIEEMHIDGEIEEYVNKMTTIKINFFNLIMKENNVTNGVFFGGGYLYESGCFFENQTYKTEESDWLIMDNNSDNILSGTLYITDSKTVKTLKYIYQGSMVTVYDGNKQGTFSQSDLRAESASELASTSCE